MDKEEFRIKLDEINHLVELKDYKGAMVIVDSIDWRKVKSVRTLCTVGEIYAANKRYEESREIFLLAYHRSPVGKTMLYRLIEVSIKMGDLDEALEYYSEFVNAAPNDNTKYILKYKIYSARNASIEEQIQILEEYKENEFTERWSFELAKLYYQAGEKEKCTALCDDIVLWFSEGKYVIKSLDIKKKLTGLTPVQLKIYEDHFRPTPVLEKPVIEDSVKLYEKDIKKESTKINEEEKNEQDKKSSIEETLRNISLTTPVIDEDENFHQKIGENIRDIFQNKGNGFSLSSEEDMVEKQITGQINIADILPPEVSGNKKDAGEETEEINKEEVPSLEPEIFKPENLPTLDLPVVNLHETAKVEDLPISDPLEFNLEDTILAAAKEQGINVPKEQPVVLSEPDEWKDEDSIKDDLVVPFEEKLKDEIEEESIEVIEEPEEELSEEEILMKFIDEQNSDSSVDLKDIIPREEKLDEEELKLFAYFTAVPGMKEQLIEVLKDAQMAAADKTSTSGNIIVMGNKGSGKTSLSEKLIKAICRELKMPAAKTAKITGEQLNGKNVAKIIDKLSGGFLLIQSANQLNGETVEKLNQAMEFRTDGLTVLIEDEKIGMRKFIAKYPKFVVKFTSTVSIPVFTNDELVNFAKVYTADLGYKIDDMAVLALYTLISDNQKEDEPMTVEGVRMFLDNAISKADSSARKLKRNLSKTRTNNEGLILLYEKDFK